MTGAGSFFAICFWCNVTASTRAKTNHWRLTNCWSIVGVPEQNLWSGVGERAARGLQFLSGAELIAEAEVRELDHAQLLEEDHVFGLQVTVNDVEAMAEGDGVHNLPEVLFGRRLIQAGVVPYWGKEGGLEGLRSI